MTLHLLDTTMLYTPAGGGVLRYLLAKRRWLAKHTRVRHTLLVPGPRDGDGPHGESVRRCAAFPGSPYRVPLAVGAWARAIAAHGPDIVEVGDVGTLALAASRARRRAGFAVVAFCHSDVERSARARFGRPTARVVRRYAREVYAGADRVIAPSFHMRARLADWGVHDVAVCPLGADLDTFHPGRRSGRLRRRLGLAPATRLFVYAGRFAPEKNLDVVVAAFERLGPSHHLLLVGSGPLPTLPRNASAMPHQDDAAALARTLAGADAFVHGGDQETFGLGYVEAMACGLPVIAADGGAAREIVTPACGTVVRARDPDALAEAVRSLAGADREAMGRAARARAEARYDWDTAFARIAAVYAGIAGERAAVASRLSPPPAAAA